MTNNDFDLARIQMERLAHIEFKAYFFDGVGRKDLIDRFGIKDAAATRDLTKYQDLAPNNLLYDTKRKLYVPAASFSPIFKFSTNRVLSTLAEGFGDGLQGNDSSTLMYETPHQLNQPDLKVVSVLSRAMQSKKVVRIEYNSLSSGKTKREIIPFALIDTGLRWHIRAWDRKRERFSDFIVTRIQHPKIINSSVEEHEQQKHDHNWNKIIELELIPHPSIQYKETVEIDYGMTNGSKIMSLRAAVIGYVLRRWNVDCSCDHSLQGGEYHLALKNPHSLDPNIETMVLAPGFNSDSYG